MEEITKALDILDHELRAAALADPLTALATIGAVQREIAVHQRDAVRAAAQRHSWAEIGEALGVSKQAAHQRYAKEWAATLKGELKAESRAFKTALRNGEYSEAGAAKAKLDAVIDEFKGVNGRGR